MESIDTRWVYRSRQWTRLSKRMRRKHPRCVNCGATCSGCDIHAPRSDRTCDLHADHRLSPKQGGAPFDPNNVDVLCGRCNRSKGMGPLVPVTDPSSAERSLRSPSPGGTPPLFRTPSDDDVAAVLEELEHDPT